MLPACGLALQGGQCQFDPFGILGVGLLEVFELGRDDGVILHIDKGSGQVGGEPRALPLVHDAEQVARLAVVVAVVVTEVVVQGGPFQTCLLYTSDAADERVRV